PVAVVSVLLILLTVATLAGLGVTVPWSPKMDAWTATATPIRYVKGRSPLELQGALVLQNKQCRTCHSLGGEGGKRGPALEGIAPGARSARSPGAAGRWEHAGVRKESEPRRGQRARRVHGDVAAMSAPLVEPSVAIPVTLTAVVYLRGWSRLRHRLARRFRSRHAVLFLASLGTMLLALSSPVAI